MAYWSAHLSIMRTDCEQIIQECTIRNAAVFASGVPSGAGMLVIITVDARHQKGPNEFR
jgi:hypothetical protein